MGSKFEKELSEDNEGEPKGRERIGNGKDAGLLEGLDGAKDSS